MSTKIPFLKLTGLWLAVYFLFAPLFFDNRDGSVARVGKGSPRTWNEMTRPTSSTTGESNVPTSGGMLYMLEGQKVPRMSFLLIHDLAEHAGALSDFAGSLAQQCLDFGTNCNVYALDLAGHGLSAFNSERQGSFRTSEWLQQIVNATNFIREKNQDTAVFLVGFGFGGEVALQASMASEQVTGVVSNGLLLPNEVRFRSQTQIDIVKGIAGDIAEILLHTTRLFTPAIFNFIHFYDDVKCEGSAEEPNCVWVHDSATYEEHMLDPLSVWYYTLPSIRSLFTSRANAASNVKPILVVGGELDKVFAAAHMEACFAALGGPKLLRLDPRGGHSALRRRRKGGSDGERLVVGWAVAVLDGTLNSLQARRTDLVL